MTTDREANECPSCGNEEATEFGKCRTDELRDENAELRNDNAELRRTIGSQNKTIAELETAVKQERHTSEVRDREQRQRIAELEVARNELRTELEIVSDGLKASAETVELLRAKPADRELLAGIETFATLIKRATLGGGRIGDKLSRINEIADELLARVRAASDPQPGITREQAEKIARELWSIPNAGDRDGDSWPSDATDYLLRELGTAPQPDDDYVSPPLEVVGTMKCGPVVPVETAEKELYYDLLSHVEKKCPSETRHDAAKRYIREAQGRAAAAKMEGQE